MQFRELASRLCLDDKSPGRNFQFIRTTSNLHISLVNQIWKKLYDSGDIYKGTHRGWYCMTDECFYPEHQVDTVKKCLHTDPAKTVIYTEEVNYIFRLNRYHQKILDWIQQGENSPIIPFSRSHDLLAMLRDPIKDISVSRPRISCPWGIPVPGDDTQTIYVWFDALVAYHTAILSKPYSQTPGVNGSTEMDDILKLHVIGKDILRFHGIILPALLMAADLPLPKKILVHGHWTAGGTKMSKSLGNVIDPFQFVDGGADSLRFFLLSTSRLDADQDFEISSIRNCFNKNLVNGFGNLFSRSFLSKSIHIPPDLFENVTCNHHEIEGKILKLLNSTALAYDEGEFNQGIEIARQIIREADVLLNERRPWLPGTCQKNVRETLATVGMILANYAMIMQPVIPNAATKVLDFFKVSPQQRHFNIPVRPQSFKTESRNLKLFHKLH